MAAGPRSVCWHRQGDIQPSRRVWIVWNSNQKQPAGNMAPMPSPSPPLHSHAHIAGIHAASMASVVL